MRRVSGAHQPAKVPHPDGFRYHVPANVQEHIDYITPGIKLYATKAKKPASAEIEKRSRMGHGGRRGHKPKPPPKKPMPPSLPALGMLQDRYCDTVVTPECIQTMYNFTAGTLKILATTTLRLI
jgi:tripeptidyl-peptidase-1